MIILMILLKGRAKRKFALIEMRKKILSKEIAFGKSVWSKYFERKGSERDLRILRDSELALSIIQRNEKAPCTLR